MGSAAQQNLHLLGRLADHAARLSGRNLPLQLKEGLIGTLEALCQDCCNIQEPDRIYSQQGRPIGDVKLRSFQRTYIGCMRLAQQHGWFAEYRTGIAHLRDLNALFNFDHALLKDQQPAGARPGGEYALARLVGCERETGELPLKACDVGNEGYGHASCPATGRLYASCRCKIGVYNTEAECAKDRAVTTRPEPQCSARVLGLL